MMFLRSFASAILPMVVSILSPMSLVPCSFQHVLEGAALGHLDQRRVCLGVVRDVFHEEQGEDVVLVEGGIHAAAELVTAVPERAVQLGLLQSHTSPFLVAVSLPGSAEDLRTLFGALSI